MQRIIFLADGTSRVPFCLQCGTWSQFTRKIATMFSSAWRLDPLSEVSWEPRSKKAFLTSPSRLCFCSLCGCWHLSCSHHVPFWMLHMRIYMHMHNVIRKHNSGNQIGKQCGKQVTGKEIIVPLLAPQLSLGSPIQMLCALQSKSMCLLAVFHGSWMYSAGTLTSLSTTWCLWRVCTDPLFASMA